MIDGKLTAIQETPGLGDWKNIQTENSVKLPFKTPEGEFALYLPLFDSAFIRAKTESSYGYPENARILVVDDSVSSRKYSRQYLAMGGYFNVDECPDGQSAFTKLFGSHPRFNLVVADWHMPNMTGFELLKKIRATPEIKDVPVILVTGERNKEEIMNAIRAGVNGYLIKPIEPGSFLATVKKTGKSSDS
ncbi:MAG: response regulator [Flavobacterium sp.]|nr:MAG: response regulator [Flavobacterium sp.]